MTRHRRHVPCAGIPLPFRPPGRAGFAGVMHSACDKCLRRTDLIAAVAGSIDVAWREKRGRTARVLALHRVSPLEVGDGAGDTQHLWCPRALRP